MMAVVFSKVVVTLSSVQGASSPLTVQWADPELQTRKRKLVQAVDDANMQVPLRGHFLLACRPPAVQHTWHCLLSSFRSLTCGACAPQVFFAKVSRTATEDDVRAVLGQCGTVMDISLFRAHGETTISKVSAPCSSLLSSTDYGQCTLLLHRVDMIFNCSLPVASLGSVARPPSMLTVVSHTHLHRVAALRPCRHMRRPRLPSIP